LSRAVIALGRSFSDAGNAIFPGKRRAAVVLVANERTREALPSGLVGRVVVLPENAVDTSQWNPPRVAAVEDGQRFVFIGRLVDWKALDVAIEAMRDLPEASLDVIGDGPMMAAWRARAESLGIAQRVRFHGWLSQEKCAELLGGCTALLLPSLYESGGAVVLEAMAMKRPVVATAWGGPSDYLDANCGVLVEPTNRTELVEGFRDAMQRLMESPDLRKRMGAAGREKLLREFDWRRKIDRVLDIYASVLESVGVGQ
jgi:glycosyltransferase involved in cell wall biosynthesis